MKEERFFYVPGAADKTELPPEEAAHAVKVLRLREGDSIFLIDGQGAFHRATVTMASNHHCLYAIEESMPQQPLWNGNIHIAVAPTKLVDRMEWLAEKATEVGINQLSFLLCRFSERRVVKADRIERIVVAAMKQSRKAWKPVVGSITPFADFIAANTAGRRFIAHCYEEIPRHDLFACLCSPQVAPDDDVTILIGPEGDFSIDEVKMAVKAGFIPVSLGNSRLRTETAALAAVMMAKLSKSLQSP